MSIVIGLRKLAFNKNRRAETWKLIADLLGSGYGLAEALEVSADVALQTRQKSVAKLLIDIREGIPRGEFSSRIANYTSGSEAMLFESVGTADEKRIFDAAFRLATQEAKTSQAIQGAIAMPTLLFIGIGILFYILGSQLYPALAEISPISTWGLMPQIIAGGAIWFSSNILFVVGLISAVIVSFWFLLPRWTGFGRHFADRFPPFSLYKMQVGTGYIFTVTELGKMGTSLNSRTLRELADIASPYSRSRILAIADGLVTKRLGQAAIDAGHEFPSNLLNAVLRGMDNKDDWIFKFSRFLDRYLERYEHMIKVQTRILNFVLMAMVAGAIPVTMMSTFAIMQSLQQ
jgi:type II secretory pathway component PulF